MTTVIAFVGGMMVGGMFGLLMAAVLMASREEIDTKAEPQTLCEDCKYRNTEECPMYYEEWVSRDYDGYIESDIVVHDRTLDEGFCDRGGGR